VAGAGKSASGDATSSLSWTLTGPGTNRSLGTGTTLPDLVPPSGGWAPGTYTLTAVPDGAAAGATSRVFTITGDADADGIPDSRDSRALFGCYPEDAVTNAANALADYDGDLLPSIVDPAPCVSAMNSGVVFNPETLNLVSSGNPITLTLSTSLLDVRRLQLGEVTISQVGGHDASIPAYALTARSASVLEAKFARQDFIDFFNARGLLGYVPVVLSASRGGITARGFDAKAPVYQP
jgi:hypothetical protein